MAFADRVVEFPGRVVLTPVPGETNTYDMTRAEGTVTEEGTPLNAQNLNEEISSMIAAAVSPVANSMQSGRVLMQPRAANVVTMVSVTFPQPFESIPNVVATAVANPPNACSVAVGYITTTGFNLYFYRTTKTNTEVCWFAHA